MAVAVAGTPTVGEVATGTTVTCNVPAGVVAGELLVAAVGADHTVNTGTPDQTGWTKILGFGAGTIATTLYYRWATASEPASYTFTGIDDGNHTLMMFRLSGVDATTPVDTTPVTAGGTTSTTLTVPSMTTTVDGALAVYLIGVQSTDTTRTFTPPAGPTLAVQSTGVGRRSATYTEARPTAGAIGTRTFTCSNSLPFVGTAAVFRPTAGPAVPVLAQQFAGRASGTDYRVAVECTNTTTARLQVATDAGFTTGVITGTAIAPTVRDGIGYAHPTVTGLAPGTHYYWRVGLEDTGGTVTYPGAVGEFDSDTGTPTGHRFVFASCLDGTVSAALDGMAAQNPDLTAFVGDFYYQDAKGGSLAEFRASFRTQIRAADMETLGRTAGQILLVPDDHDGHSNDGTYAADPTAWTNWNTVYREMLATPALPQATRGIYDTFVWKGVRYILLDTRSYAQAGTTVLGATQKQWLFDTIDAAVEDAIVIVQGSVWHGPSETGDGWLGTIAERNEVAAYLGGSGKNIVMTAGDMHAVAADDGTNSPGGIPLFHAAPMHNSASQKGGPTYTAGPYPASGTAVVEQFGVLDISFTATQVTFAFTGYSAPSTARVTESVTMARTSLPAEGTATGSWSYSGSATGTTTRTGIATGTVTYTGTASGTTTRTGSAGGSWGYTGTATGHRDPAGTATGSVTWAGAATGYRVATGTAAGTYAYAGTATGTAPASGTGAGSAAGAFGWTGTATGATTRSGTAVGAFGYVGTAVGDNGTARDITVTVADVTARTLDATTATGRTLTATVTARELGATATARTLDSGPVRARTLTGRLED